MYKRASACWSLESSSSYTLEANYSINQDFLFLNLRKDAIHTYSFIILKPTKQFRSTMFKMRHISMWYDVYDLNLGHFFPTIDFRHTNLSRCRASDDQFQYRAAWSPNEVKLHTFRYNFFFFFFLAYQHARFCGWVWTRSVAINFNFYALSKIYEIIYIKYTRTRVFTAMRVD